MTRRFNPFVPNSPVHSGMFTGRLMEVEGIDRSLFQTKNGNPAHILLIGERGIGKTSLLIFAEAIASGEIPALDDSSFNFLTLSVSITDDLNLLDFARKIGVEVENEFNKENSAVKYMKGIWNFAKKIEISTPIAKAKFTDVPNSETEAEVVDRLISSLSNTIELITTDKGVSTLGIVKKKDGIVLLIDEADNAKSLKLGQFLKNLTEVLPKKGTDKLLIILAGLPELRDVLINAHPSSLRLFQEYALHQLSIEEVEEVVKKGVDVSNRELKHGAQKLSVEREAIELIFNYSEGYPHFVQQIAYSSFEVNKDDVISKKDVGEAFFGKQGALILIGNRYYRHIYNGCPKFTREILTIMAESSNRWISRDKIKKKFKGNSTSFDKGLKILKEKGAILKKGDQRGMYRLQWKGFAYWLKFMNIQEGVFN